MDVVVFLQINQCTAEMDITFRIGHDGINSLNIHVSGIAFKIKAVRSIVKRIHLGVGEAACQGNVVGRRNQRAKGIALGQTFSHRCRNIGKEANTVIVTV